MLLLGWEYVHQISGKHFAEPFEGFKVSLCMLSLRHEDDLAGITRNPVKLILLNFSIFIINIATSSFVRDQEIEKYVQGDSIFLLDTHELEEIEEASFH